MPKWENDGAQCHNEKSQLDWKKATRFSIECESNDNLQTSGMSWFKSKNKKSDHFPKFYLLSISNSNKSSLSFVGDWQCSVKAKELLTARRSRTKWNLTSSKFDLGLGRVGWHHQPSHDFNSHANFQTHFLPIPSRRTRAHSHLLQQLLRSQSLIIHTHQKKNVVNKKVSNMVSSLVELKMLFDAHVTKTDRNEATGCDHRLSRSADAKIVGHALKLVSSLTLNKPGPSCHTGLRGPPPRSSPKKASRSLFIRSLISLRESGPPNEGKSWPDI